MKTLLKLIFLGAIIGVTIKFLNEKQINVIDEALSIIERIEEKLASIDAESDDRVIIEQEPQDTNRDPVVEEYSNPKNRTLPSNPKDRSVNSEASGGQSYSPAKSRSRLDLTGTDVKAMEITIPEKSLLGENRFHELDKYGASVPESYDSDMDMLLEYLMRPAEDELEKSRLLYSWIATHVRYDDYGFNTGDYGDLSAEGVFYSRRAVCQGFAELFKVMGERAGLEIVLVIGYAKGITYRKGQPFDDTNHAWNVIKINKRWSLCDVTWGRGYGTAVNGKLVSVSEFDDYWFDTPPDEFLFTHFPEDDRWLLSSIPVSRSQFERLPHARASYFKFGFDGTYCLKHALEGSLNNFPVSYFNDGSVKALSLPYQERIPANQPVTVRLKSSTASDMAIVNNGEWVHLRKDGDEFMAVIAPQPGKLTLNVRFDDRERSYNTLLAYRVN